MEVTVPQSFKITVHDQSQVGEARREASLLADKLGLDEETAGRLSIAATEAGRNLHLHGGGGEIILNKVESKSRPGVELLAIDRGRGMPDLEKCMRDGYSTTGTPGTGLGAIVRLSDRFDLYSVPAGGTVVMARFFSRRNPRQQQPELFEYSASSVAFPGEPVCGDAWAVKSSSASETFLLVDGLGHGRFAEEAAHEAVRVFHSSDGAKPGEVIERAHGALRGTRGAALAVARVDHQQQRVVFSGIGNISASVVVGGIGRSMVSFNGTVGHQMHKVQEFVYPWTSDALLIMHSDGLTTRWDLATYPGLTLRSPGVIAGVLYRDFNRHRDDVTVLVARCAPE